jgi:transketolase
MISESSLRSLQGDAFAIRRCFLRMHFDAHAGHIGTGLSDIDILAYIYRRWLRHEDRFILSKGHGASSLYATLHHFGIMSSEDLRSYYKDGTSLPAHPAPAAFPAIPAATGSLGHGLPIAAGHAYAYKYLHRTDQRVACLLSDGECDEGAVWEAALFAAHHKLANLTVIIDANGLQGFGPTEQVLALEPLVPKWEAFGFRTREVNGHDFRELEEALGASPDRRPTCVVARTVKGKGVRLMEGKLEWHYLPMSQEQYAGALADLDAAEKQLELSK